MAIFVRIRDVFAQRGAGARDEVGVLPAVEFSIELPPEDAPDAVLVYAERPGVEFVSELVAIRYVDAKGNRSTRRVTVRRIYEKDADLALACYCHERRAPRLFLASRIEELIDLSTGEAFDDAPLFLRRHVAFDPAAGGAKADATRQALDRVRPDLAVLVFLAACDGSFDPEERDAILEYVAERCGDLDYDHTRVFGYVSRLHPDEDTFFDAIETLAEREDSDLAALARGAVAVVEADGVIDDAEFAFITAMREAFAEYGITM